MSLDTARAYFEQRQKDLFRDTATIERPSTGGTLDPVTGVWTPDPATVIYTGECLLRAFVWEGTDVQAGSLEIRLRRLRAKFPPNTDIQREDIVIPTASVYDDSLIGVTFHCVDVFRDGWQISRVAIVEEVT